MTAQVVTEPVLDELSALHPQCESAYRDQPCTSPASHAVHCHGCKTILLCCACTTAFIEGLRDAFAAGKILSCLVCTRRARTVDAFVTEITDL